jgi:hypothetical protein
MKHPSKWTTFHESVNRISLFILILILLFISSCKSTPDLTEDDIYEIVNEIIRDDSISITKVCPKFEELTLKTEYEREFTKLDIEFIRNQQDIFKNLIIMPNKLKTFGMSFIYLEIDTICKYSTHISFPLISKNRRKVIIQFDQLGHWGGEFLYKKKNDGRWTRIKEFSFRIY